MKKIIPVVSLFFLLLTNSLRAQTPAPALVGYWQNWQDSQSPYIQLTQVDSSYNMIMVSFATPVEGTTYNMTFTPEVVTQAMLKAQIDTMKMRGKKVNISIGGANHPIYMLDTNQRNTFINSLFTIITTYNFDGVDIDIEGASIPPASGTINNPTDPKMVNMIEAIKRLMVRYRQQYNKKMSLTMAPETAYITGGFFAYSGINGALLPLVQAFRDSIDVIHPQLYNSGSMYGLDSVIYNQGTADFIISQTESLIRGFTPWTTPAAGTFLGINANKVAIGLPACSSAAGGGYVHPDTVKAAINYLRGLAPKPAHYTLKGGPYPTLRGMMTWSINWDAVSTCHPRYEFANNYYAIFHPVGSNINNISSNATTFKLHQNYPNPFNPSTSIRFSLQKTGFVSLKIYDINGKEVAVLINNNLSQGEYIFDFNANELPSGTYFYKLSAGNFTETKKMMLVK
ncbi:MAG TPA: glycosyl hydrolase family 18 protein [Ignavibacteria bacterium]|nr:glycosyl hydrolase family 18 protein [Ignavibacteria bacterium]